MSANSADESTFAGWLGNELRFNFVATKSWNRGECKNKDFGARPVSPDKCANQERFPIGKCRKDSARIFPQIAQKELPHADAPFVGKSVDRFMPPSVGELELLEGVTEFGLLRLQCLCVTGDTCKCYGDLPVES
jgi:hypothetical protein